LVAPTTGKNDPQELDAPASFKTYILKNPPAMFAYIPVLPPAFDSKYRSPSSPFATNVAQNVKLAAAGRVAFPVKLAEFASTSWIAVRSGYPAPVIVVTTPVFVTAGVQVSSPPLAAATQLIVGAGIPEGSDSAQLRLQSTAPL
jgi:hypothetical protein